MADARVELLMLSPDYGPFIHMGACRGPNKQTWSQALGDSFGLFASLDGILSLTAPDGEQERHPGPAAVLTTPGQAQSLRLSGSEWYLLRFDVVFRRRRRRSGRGHAWEPLPDGQHPSPEAIWGHAPPTLVPPPLCRGAIQLLRDCCALWWRGDLFHAQANAGLGYWLINYLVATRSDGSRAATGDDLVERCRVLVRERLSYGVNVADLATAVGYSRAQFIRRFTARAGMSPGCFIREERLVQACRLLTIHDWPVADVANHCGYRSTAAFSRAFKAAHHCSPSTWRRRQR